MIGKAQARIIFAELTKRIHFSIVFSFCLFPFLFGVHFSLDVWRLFFLFLLVSGMGSCTKYTMHYWLILHFIMD